MQELHKLLKMGCDNAPPPLHDNLNRDEGRRASVRGSSAGGKSALFHKPQTFTV